MCTVRRAAIGGVVSAMEMDGGIGETHFVSRSAHQRHPLVVYYAVENSELNEREQSKLSSVSIFDIVRLRFKL